MQDLFSHPRLHLRPLWLANSQQPSVPLDYSCSKFVFLARCLCLSSLCFCLSCPYLIFSSPFPLRQHPWRLVSGHWQVPGAVELPEWRLLLLSLHRLVVSPCMAVWDCIAAGALSNRSVILMPSGRRSPLVTVLLLGSPI